ncbi:uncharacterized protein [Periplaneta americana]|uniref:uncharacterized protein n=1 Tax=Periplaneta americana TaxID=6978 RepID=UPI0037E8D173
MEVVMDDMLQSEPEVDPLAIQPSDRIYLQERKPLPEEGNILDVHVVRIKAECMDQNYDLTSEVKFEGIPDPCNFPVVKCEAEEDTLLDSHVTGIKTECGDHSYDLTSEMTFMEDIPSDVFPMVKSESEEGSRDLDKVKEELKQEITTEQNDILSDRRVSAITFISLLWMDL